MGGTLAVAPGIEFQSSCLSSSKANGPSNSVHPLMSTIAGIWRQSEHQPADGNSGLSTFTLSADPGMGLIQSTRTGIHGGVTVCNSQFMIGGSGFRKVWGDLNPTTLSD